MKAKLLVFVTALLLSSSLNAQYQKSILESSKHFHDLNIAPLADGSSDYIVAGNLFNATMTSSELMLKRVDNLGNLVWLNRFTHPTLQNLRVFDVVAYESLVIITGSVDVSGARHVFVSKIHATTGAMIDARYYELVSANFNSVGLNIEFTDKDATGNGIGDIGFIIGGFFGDCYNVDINCNNNLGFVLRTDFSLNELWTIEVDSNLSTNTLDYDFVNGITETDDGYFLTGSCTVVLASGMEQQAVLAHKVDFQGAVQWDKSYYVGNDRDVSVDAYYDVGADELFMLNNYSFSHYFAVTVLDDSGPGAGTIDLSRSWYAFEWNDLNRYGFTIMESVSDTNNLVISGYDRDETWVDGNSTTQFGNSNVFVYEFNKATGNQVGTMYQYTVPHVEPSGDDYNYWLWQMPLMYYPDMSYEYRDPGNTNSAYYHVGYRTMGSGTTESELYRTTNSKLNDCDYIDKTLSKGTITPSPAPVVSGNVPNNSFSFSINDFSVSTLEENCESTLGGGDSRLEQNGIYPNPTSERLYVTKGDYRGYSVVNALGLTVKQGNLSSDNSLYVGDLADGVYILQVHGMQGSISSYKFIKN